MPKPRRGLRVHGLPLAASLAAAACSPGSQPDGDPAVDTSDAMTFRDAATTTARPAVDASFVAVTSIDASTSRPDAAAPSDATPAPDASSLAATVRPSPDNVVSAVVDVVAPAPGTVTIRFGAGALDRTVSLVATSAGTLSVPVLGLDAETAYTFVASFSVTGTPVVSSTPLALTTGAWPADLPPVVVTTSAPAMTDYLLLSLIHFGSTSSFAAIVDRAGKYQWYRRGGPPSTLGFDFARWPGGHYTVYQSAPRNFLELDLTGTVFHTWSGNTADGLDGHDLVLNTDGTILAIAPGTHVDDTRAYVDGGVADATVMDLEIQEIERDGETETVFSSWPTIGLDETSSINVSPGTAVTDALHPNSLAYASDGRLLLSLRHTNTILKIDPATGAIVWRLGGIHNDFTFVGDSFNGPSHQHFVRELPGGTLLYFDNGDTHTPQVSRAIEYRLDEARHTATVVWEYHHAPELYADAAGNAERLANGDTLVSWGSTGQTTQVDTHGTVKWEAVVAGWMVYRARAVDSLTP